MLAGSEAGPGRIDPAANPAGWGLSGPAFQNNKSQPRRWLWTNLASLGITATNSQKFIPSTRSYQSETFKICENMTSCTKE